MRAAVAMRGAHRTWVLDDGRSDEVRLLAAEEGASYVRRLSSNGAKAGNINHALSIAKGAFFVILDADFVPRENLIVEMLPFFAHDDVAFVQSPQAYGNLTTVVARGAAYMQTVFYRFIQPGRNRFNAAFCVGTNVMFRRRAIDDVGGVCTDSKSEDVWTSLRLHERGWRSVYLSDVLAIGEAPETGVLGTGGCRGGERGRVGARRARRVRRRVVEGPRRGVGCGRAAAGLVISPPRHAPRRAAPPRCVR